MSLSRLRTLREGMRAFGEPVPTIAQTLGVSAPTMYRLLAERSKGGLIA